MLKIMIHIFRALQLLEKNLSTVRPSVHEQTNSTYFQGTKLGVSSIKKNQVMLCMVERCFYKLSFLYTCKCTVLPRNFHRELPHFFFLVNGNYKDG